MRSESTLEEKTWNTSTSSDGLSGSGTISAGGGTPAACSSTAVQNASKSSGLRTVERKSRGIAFDMARRCRRFSHDILLASHVMSDITPAVRADLAPTGTLRAGINYGNFILATR